MAKKAASVIEIVEGDELGEALRKLIDTSGVSRYEIANATGMQQPALSRMYNGQASVTLKTLAKVARHLGFSVSVVVEKD